MEKFVQEPNLRGKFNQPAPVITPLVRLDERVFQYLSEKAQHRGVQLEDLVNDLLKKSIELSWRLT
jgi:hypothetical protein